MKKNQIKKLLKVLQLHLVFSFALLTCFSAFSQSGVAINTTGAATNPSAMLDVSSTNSGILIPRLTEAQKGLILSPATGLMIYQTDAITGFWYYDGAAWVQSIGTTGPAGVTGPTGADGITGATGLLSSGTAIGNTPYWNGSQWVVNSSNIFNNGGSIGIGTSSPDASSKMEIASTNSGLLIPRMTNAERNLIASPADGLQIYNTITKCLEFFVDGLWRPVKCSFICGSNVTFNYNGSSVTYGSVNGGYNSGQYCWLDRNLGATAVATAYNDINAFGDLFQWGRLDDGHQNRISVTTSTLSNNDFVGHANFIIAPSSPNDWRSPQKDALWQGASGINNICPAGWRLPTETELNNECLIWNQNNYNGAIASLLKLPTSGYRPAASGALGYESIRGRYWSSTASSTLAKSLRFDISSVVVGNLNRADGISVRCIRDY